MLRNGGIYLPARGGKASSRSISPWGGKNVTQGRGKKELDKLGLRNLRLLEDRRRMKMSGEGILKKNRWEGSLKEGSWGGGRNQDTPRMEWGKGKDCNIFISWSYPGGGVKVLHRVGGSEKAKSQCTTTLKRMIRFRIPSNTRRPTAGIRRGSSSQSKSKRFGSFA